MTDVLGFDTVPSPIGDLLAVVSTNGLARLAFADEDHDAVLVALCARRATTATRDPVAVAPYATEISGYLSGARRDWSVAVDLSDVTGFRRDVLEAMATIPYGDVRSYGELAAMAGRPRAARAAGTACATNPVPLVVPCHRVVRSGGALGNYGGGVEVKARLLSLEAAAVQAGAA